MFHVPPSPHCAATYGDSECGRCTTRTRDFSCDDIIKPQAQIKESLDNSKLYCKYFPKPKYDEINDEVQPC